MTAQLQSILTIPLSLVCHSARHTLHNFVITLAIFNLLIFVFFTFESLIIKRQLIIVISCNLNGKGLISRLSSSLAIAF